MATAMCFTWSSNAGEWEFHGCTSGGHEAVRFAAGREVTRADLVALYAAVAFIAAP